MDAFVVGSLRRIRMLDLLKSHQAYQVLQLWRLLESAFLHPAELVVPDPEGLELRQALERLPVQDPDHVGAEVDRLQRRHVVQRIRNLR